MSYENLCINYAFKRINLNLRKKNTYNDSFTTIIVVYTFNDDSLQQLSSFIFLLTIFYNNRGCLSN